MQIGLTADNFKEILDKIFVGKVGFCVNLSIGVSSSDVTQYCQAKGIFYIDTAKCGWTGYHQ
jgi:homospermidine synthase